MAKKEDQDAKDQANKNRRHFVKRAISIPILGAFGYQYSHSTSNSDQIKPTPNSSLTANKNNHKPRVRIGIIGFGARGESLARSLGFAHTDWIRKNKPAKENSSSINLFENWVQQDDLNIELAGICDVFDLRAERGIAASLNYVHRNNKRKNKAAKRYLRYQDMLESPDIDAVIISTPDFHHAQMTIDAVNAGKHTYCEKCMTRTEQEAHKVYATVKSAELHKAIVFQLGHQYPQTEAYRLAKLIVNEGLLGKITLVETSTNRNTPDGAWVRHLDKAGKIKPGNIKNIDWQQWRGGYSDASFSIDHYYNWTKYWDYATGLCGQLMSHEFDAANQILNLGIPASCVSSGGIYYYNDGRDIPDTFQANFEFPKKELSLVYSASLANSRDRGRIFNGKDAWMDVGKSITVVADEESGRYQSLADLNKLKLLIPGLSKQHNNKNIDAITSATAKYYDSRGLTLTHKDGRYIDVAHLHLKEWLNGIRHGSSLSCPIDKAFEVTIACHMATKSYREKRRVEWDPVTRRII